MKKDNIKNTINQKHFQTISSTQTFLKENHASLIEESKTENILISCDEQTSGIGRKDNEWDFYKKSLAMSFTVSPNPTSTLTPLEIGLISIKYFKEIHSLEIFMKWPNDLLDKNGNKCAGIICQYINPKLILSGLGINLGKQFPSNEKSYPNGFSSLDIHYSNAETLSKEIYEYINTNRIINFSELENDFNKNCFHLNHKVKIEDSVGIFKGIGESGEALVQTKKEIEKIYSGSLEILEC